jgi:hypothetical protein
MSKSKQDSEVETIRFRQAVYLNFTKTHLIPDPCGQDPVYEKVVACCIEMLMLEHNSRSATLRGYLQAINTLFSLRGFKIPCNLSDQTNMCTLIINNREIEACRRSPITNSMYAAIIAAKNQSIKDSIDDIFADWLSLIQITGQRCAEFAQKTQTKVDVHTYPSGKQVIKAFISTDWKFYDNNGISITIHPLHNEITIYPSKVKITFRIQKKCQNGQKLTVLKEFDHSEICPVRAANRIFIRARRLGQKECEPMGVYLNKQGVKKYLTGNVIANLLRTVARLVHLDMSEEDIQ